eukprot:TRINITY_DN28908_c0_g2_i1.p1 TRINITY_DN28908_c0_g2~~TRINITY_DN28908_c0_g2_i1.p1  ORF type:complete len:519 (-),score=62.55 TRINITY_DN28908_c0_g2_i1:54-1610(-)
MWSHCRIALPVACSARIAKSLLGVGSEHRFLSCEANPDSRSDIDTKSLFTKVHKWQSWLTVEGNLAKAQAALGIIPAEAAVEIARVTRSVHNIDLDALEKDIRRTKSPILSLVKEISSNCDGSAGGYVHWGATTQNVQVTGLQLQLRQAHSGLLSQLAHCLEAISALADEPLGAERVCAGRTLHRQGLPITWGFRIAIWAEELVRHSERLLDASDRVFALTFGGALGAFHALDGDQRVAKELGMRLGMKPVVVPSRASHDGIAEYLLLIALLSSTVSRIAFEIYAMQSDEFAEIKEVQARGVVGSSTMAHKVNPKFSPELISLAARTRAACVFPALEMSQPTRDGDQGTSLLVYDAVPHAVVLADQMLRDLAHLLKHIEPNEDAMARNLKLSEPGNAHDGSGGSLLCTENAMMRLGAATAASAGDGKPGGRQWAHDVVHEAVGVAVKDNKSIADVLLSNADVRAALDESDIIAMVQPRNYLGACVPIAKTAVKVAEDTASKLRKEAAHLQRLDACTKT